MRVFGQELSSSISNNNPVYSFHDGIFRPIVNSSGAYLFSLFATTVIYIDRGLGPPLIIATFWKYCCAGGDAACVVGFCDGGCAWSSESPKGWRTQI